MITPEQIAANGSEHSQQAALFCYAASSGIPELKWLFAIPNGFFASPAQKAKMKAEGLRSGVSDIMLPVVIPYDQRVGRGYHGLFLEMKTEDYRSARNGGLRPEQKEFLDFVSNQGYKAAVCYSWQEARDCILEYLGKR